MRNRCMDDLRLGNETCECHGVSPFHAHGRREPLRIASLAISSSCATSSPRAGWTPAHDAPRIPSGDVTLHRVRHGSEMREPHDSVEPPSAPRRVTRFLLAGVGVATLAPLLLAKVGEDVFEHESGSFEGGVRTWMLHHGTPSWFVLFA